jgi:hypothetical protein
MNQLDWEKMQENVTIADAKPILENRSYNPSEYIPQGSTSWLSGNISDLTLDDNAYMTFGSYYSGVHTSYFVNNTSNVDSSADKGTHSNFTALQSGPDSIYDTLTEKDTLNTTFGKTNVGASSYGSANFLEASRFLCQVNGVVTKITLYLSGGASGRYARTAIYTDNNGVPDNLLGQSAEREITTSGWYDFTGFNVPVSANTYYWLAFQINNDKLKWRYDSGSTNQRAYRSYTYGSFPSSFGTPSGYSNWAQSIYATCVNYELDLEVQWTEVDYTKDNAELCIYAGALGSENLRIDVWSGSNWFTLINSLQPNQWNNASIKAYLTSNTFTIRFKGSTETNDSSQDSWNIDVAILHVWFDEYTADVEFIGSSIVEKWVRLDWVINSAWTTSSVNVTLQLYNYTLGSYPESGYGYINYISDATPNTDENKNQTINVNPTDFRNSTGYWKVKIKGVKKTSTPFNLKVDLVELKTTSNVGTTFTFSNSGPTTLHIVAIWMIDAANHKRYEVNLFVNAGGVTSIIHNGIILPDNPYIIKVVTERGNIAVLTSD